MLIQTRARGVPHAPSEKMIKSGEIWCIISVPKYVIINLKINDFKDNKSTTQILCHLFSKINPDAHVSTKINTFTLNFYDGVWGQQPPEAREIKKMEAFPFLHQILHTRRVDSPVMTWIQINAKGSGVCSPPPLNKFY